MNRFASPILKVAFEGPDVQEQPLYELCRVCTLSVRELARSSNSTHLALWTHQRSDVALTCSGRYPSFKHYHFPTCPCGNYRKKCYPRTADPLFFRSGYDKDTAAREV